MGDVRGGSARAAQRQSPVAAQDDDRGARHVPPFHDGGVPRSEGAAEAIGANALLARAGATYHDVGKTAPALLLFPRTRRTGTSTTPCRPRERGSSSLRTSAMRSHCCKNIGFPRPVRAIAAEHHGTTLVAYFYFKARQAAGDRGVGRERVSAIRGRARPRARARSSCWRIAAIGSGAVLGDATSEQVAEMVQQGHPRQARDDGQFADVPHHHAGGWHGWEKSFLVTFSGMFTRPASASPDEEEELK